MSGAFDRLPAQLAGRVELLGTLRPPAPPPALSDAEIAAALRNPVWPDGARRTVFDVVAPGESVLFVVSDQTRRTAADRVLPPILDGLVRRGCRSSDFSALIATGIHRPPTEAETARILGAAAARLGGGVYAHDPDNEQGLVEIGVTRRGHRVRINRRAAEAERLVLLGAASYHYHAGFGGGRKALVPGVASRDTIAFNHSLTLDPARDRLAPGVEIGRLDGNPVAEEMFEAASLRRPDIIVNTVIEPGGALAGVVSGDLDAAHRAACALVEKVCRVDIAEPAHLVIASAAGAPNWIQSHKALFNAARAMRESGRVVLAAPCPEGLGNERFRHWMRRTRESANIYEELRRAPEVNGQTALSTRDRGRRCILVTSLSAADAADLGIRTAPDLATAVEAALRDLAPVARPTCWLMPEAAHSVPFASAIANPP